MGRKKFNNHLSDDDSDSNEENNIKSKFKTKINKYITDKIEHIKEQFKLNNIVSIIWLI